MTNNIFLNFENGMPKGTSQEKGECIRYKISGGKRVPYIHHFKKPKVEGMRAEFELKLKRHKPKKPVQGPVRLSLSLFFDVKRPKKLWGTYKTTKPDLDNYAKELIDAMTAIGFWGDDAQVSELKVSKRYAEKASIVIQWEELEP